MENNELEITPIKRLVEFRPGDVVVLKSGSDKMTVEKVEKNGSVQVVMFPVTGMNELKDMTVRLFFYEEGPMRYTFASEALTKAE